MMAGINNESRRRDGVRAGWLLLANMEHSTYGATNLGGSKFRKAGDGKSGHVNIPGPSSNIIVLAIDSDRIVFLHDLRNGLSDPRLLLLESASLYGTRVFEFLP
jgi:hypothetical protein